MTRRTHAGQMGEKTGAPSDGKQLPLSRHAKCISVPVLPAGTILPQRSTATPPGKTAEAARSYCTPWEYDTCKTRYPRPRLAPLNIDNSVTTRPEITSPRSRHRVAKAPKPVPYLKPVPSSAARRSEGESGRVRVRFVSSVNRRQSRSRVVSRTQSEKLPPRKELAYLIVDLRSGTPTNLKSKSSEELSEVFQPSLDTKQTDTKEPQPNNMSLSTELPIQPRPKPIPRRRTIGGSSCSSVSEKESTPPPPIPPKPGKKPAQPTPAPRKPRVFSLPHAPSEAANEEQKQEVTSPHATRSNSVPSPAHLKPVPQKRQKSPPPPIPTHEPDSSAASTSQPATGSPPATECLPDVPATESPPEVPARLTKSPPQSPATAEDLPPPLPEKSSLSRQLQMSVKKNRSTPIQCTPLTAKPLELEEKDSESMSEKRNEPTPMQCTPISTKPLEPEDKDEYNMSIVQNTSYITSLHMSSSDLNTDTGEPLYTEPLMPEPFSPPRKSKPTRPPPPSSIAIQQAKERREKAQANRQGKNIPHSPAQYIEPISCHTVRNSTGHLSTTAPNTSNSTHPLPAVQSSAAPRPPDYEELDSELDRSPTDTPTRVFRVSQSSLASPSPPLPSRAPSSNKRDNRRIQQKQVPVPSGFSRHLEDSETDNSSHSTHLLPAVQSSAAPRPPDYEDMDSELDRSPTDTPTRVFRVSQSSLASPSPPLPPRAPSSNKRDNRIIQQKQAPIPSGFSSHLEDSETDNSPESSANKSEKEEEEKEEDEELDQQEPLYEPVDTSIPLPPHRSKKKIRGTRTMTIAKRNRGLTNVYTGQRASRIQKERGSLTDPVQRRTLHFSPKQSSKLAQVSSSFSSTPRLKNSFSGSISSEEGGIAKVSSVDIEHDVGGVEEYVDMQPRTAWEEKEAAEQEDKPEDSYVEMRPGDEGEESDEDRPNCGPYASSDLLSCKPELRHSFVVKINFFC